MIELAVNKLKKAYGHKQVFENVSFELHSNEIIGLIGQNGTGKSTLMKILIGEEQAEGDISLRKGIKLSYLNQIPIYDLSETTNDILYKAFNDILLKRKQMSELERQMALASGEDLDKVMNQYSQCQSEFEILGGYDIEEKLSKIITGLKLNNILDLTFNNLSGGEKTRAMLGKVLLENPDVLLLDEPTNHLDIEMVKWLEEFLKKYNGAVIVISHDRYFLDKVVNKIIELHPDGIELYHGNYSAYKIEKEKRYEEALKEYNSQQKKIKTMKEQIQRYRIWGEMRDSDKMYRRAKELEKRLAKIDELDKPSTNNQIKLNFEQEHRSGKIVYDLKKLSKSYENKELFHDVNLEVLYQDCLTIIGPNGSGKSTLIKMILGEIDPDTGTIKTGARLKVGYLPQEIEFDDENRTILETYQNYFNCTNLQARQALAGILFTKDDVFKQIKVLSGGEKTRLKLLLLMDDKVNVLILDEPTNHLDIDSREILENSLLDFNGTIIVISHDRYFINKLSNKIAELNHKTLRAYDGNFDDYINEKNKEITNDKISYESKNKSKGNKNNQHNNNEIDENGKDKKIEKLQLEIEAKENELNIISIEMAINGEKLEYLQELYNKKIRFENEIDELYKLLDEFL